MKIPQELVDQFARGNGAIFVGAGLSIGAGLPGWGQLLERFAKELPDYPKESTYLDVAQYYVNQHGTNRLVNRLRNELDTSGIESTIVHDAVAQLNISPIFTTNFDNLIEKSFLKASIKFDKVISDVDPNFWTNERTQLVKLHGDLDYPPSIVVTSEDYERYLNDRPAFVRLLTIALQTKTTLFLGYSANDIDVRSLLTLIQNEAGEYARNAFSLMFDAHQLVIQDLERRGIKVINFQNVPDKDKNPILANWLNVLKEEVEKYSSSTGMKSKKIKKNLPSEPYKFLHWFGESDINIFHGRDYEIDNLANLISSQKVVILYGESGTGKTSLLRAGVLPRLKEDGCLIGYLRPLADPYKELDETLKNCFGKSEFDATNLLAFVQENLPKEKTLVVVIDQFEEFFIRQGPQVRKKFIQTLVDLIKDTTTNIRLVFSLRSDYLDRLDELEEAIGRDPLRFRMRLHNLGPANASAAISEPAHDFKIPLETILLERLVADLEQGGIAPAQLQIVCFVLWQDWIQRNKPPIGLTYERYIELGSTQNILAEYLKNVIRDLGVQGIREELGITLDSEKTQEAAKAILKSMITSERTKIAVSGKEITHGEIVTKLKIPPSQVDALLLYLQNRRVIRHLPDTEYYELVHEVMIQQIWEWVTDEEKKLLDVQDLLVRATTDYKKFQTLLSADFLYLITEQANNLNLSDDALELLLRSAIAHNYPPKIWVEKMNPKQAIDILGQLLMSERKTAFSQIAQALGHTKSGKAIRYLDDLLADENRDIQRAAAEAMATLNLRGVIPSLFHAVMRENTLYRCAPLLDSLEIIHSEEATAMLILIASEHTDPGVKSRATSAVVRLGRPQGIRLLFGQLNSEDRSITENAIHALDAMLEGKEDDLLELYMNSDTQFRLTIVEGLRRMPGGQRLGVFNAVLSDKDPNIREAGVKALAELGNIQAAELLISALQDEKIRIRFQAIMALRQLNDARVVEPLILLLKDNDIEAREYAVTTLGGLHDDRAVVPLLESLKDEDVKIRRAAIIALNQFHTPQAIEPLIDLLQDDNIEIRLQAVLALEPFRDSRVIEPFVDLLDDDDPGIRQLAATTLGQFHDTRAIDALIDLILDKKSSYEERQSIAKSLIELNDLYALDKLIVSLQFQDQIGSRLVASIQALLQEADITQLLLTGLNHINPSVRQMAIQVLGSVNRADKVDLLLKGIKDADADVRLGAILALVELDNSLVVEPLLVALHDEDVVIRQLVISALGELKDVRAFGPLLSALKDADVEIRQLIISALSQLKDIRDVELLTVALKNEDVEIRRLAISALDRLRDERAFKPLLSALKDEDVKIRRLAISALRQLKDIRDVELLIVALKNEDVEIRRLAISALDRLNDERVFKPLIVALKDEDVEIRRLAISALGRLKDMRAVEPLIAALKDEDDEIRRLAFFSLHKLKAERTFQSLISTLKDENIEIRRQAISALGQLKDVRAVEPLIAALKDEDVEIRQLAISALGQLKDVRAVEPLVPVLKNEDVKIRRLAISALGQLRDERAFQSLISALKDEDVEIRRRAIGALGQLKDTRAVKLLIAALKDEDVEIRRLAISALSQLKDVRAIEPLISTLKDEDIEIRRLTINALGQLKDVRAIELLIFTLKDENIEIRRQAISALGQLKDVRAIEPLISTLKDEDIEIRRLAISALGQLKDKRAFQSLLSALKDEDVEIRRLAISALDSLKDVRAVEPLIAALKDEDVEIRRRAISALGQLKDVRAVEPLIAVLKEDVEIRQRAISALGQLKDVRAVEPLIAALKDEDVEIRRRAISALGLLKDARAVELLITALKDEDVEIRRRAKIALDNLGDQHAVNP